MKKFKYDIKIGDLFIRWKVISEQRYEKHSGQSYAYVTCECSCGTIRGVKVRSLISGVSRSCGCLQREEQALITRNKNLNNESNLGYVSHGYKHHPLYQVWQGMIKRCENINSKCYKYYGARGIKVCDEWHNPKIFIEWCLENGWKQGLSIDRINNNGNYEPSNCRFVDSKIQNRNKNNNRLLEIFGEIKCATDWIEDSRSAICNYATFIDRLNNGWEPERALTTPKTRDSHYLTAFGETKRIYEWPNDDRCIVEYIDLYNRTIVGNWEPEKALTTPVRQYIRNEVAK